MTDPYQQQGYGPQYGAPGTGPGMQQNPYGQPQDGVPYGASDPYNPQVFAQPGGYGPGGYAPQGMDPQAPYGRTPYGEPYSDKTKLAAGLLQIFLGGFGAGRFYLGDNNIAIAQLLVTVFTCGLGHIWGWIDAIMIFTGNMRDPYGRPLREN